MNQILWSNRVAVIAILVSFIVQPSSDAQPPDRINYQGRLVNGTNLVNGNVGLSLRLFNVASGGSALYEDSNSVSVVDGLYATLIGDNTTVGTLAGALANPAVYVEVAVNGTALTPRERLASTAYSLISGNAAITPPIDITYSNFPDSVLRIANNGGGPAIWAEATNASAIFGVNWGDGNALFVANAGSGPSAVFQGGNVGIGTQSPGEKLSVNGRVESTQGGFRFPDESVQLSASRWNVNNEGDMYYTEGDIGLGTDTPSNNLSIVSEAFAPADIGFETIRQSTSPVFSTNYNASTATIAQSGEGGSWTALSNVYSSDNQRASAQLVYNGFEQATKKLLLSDLGLSIPTNAAGIKLVIEFEAFHQSAPNCPAYITADIRVRRNGNLPFLPPFTSVTVYTNEQASSVTGTFGLTLDAGSINSNEISVEIEVVGYYGSCTPSVPTTVFVDQIRVGAQYFIPGADLDPVRYSIGVAPTSRVLVIQNESLATINGRGIYMATNGFVGLGTASPSNRLQVVGNIFASGTIQPSSDRHVKKNIEYADPQVILDRLVAMPLHTWTYNAEDEGIRHIGPMAQDFHAAFGLGASDTSIATVDADGVALAAIQALAKENGELKKENEALREEVEAIKRRLGM